MTDLTMGGPDAPDSDDDGEHAGLVAERERLARTLRDTRLQLAMTEARLAALEQSITQQLGKTLVNAAKRPWPRGAQLPRDLVKLWRGRGGGRDGAELAVKLAAAQLADLEGAGERFLSALTVPGRTDVPDVGLVVAGAFTAHGAATLAPDAVVTPLLPHDADVLLESTGADLVIIEAAALLAGAPWAYAADPSGSDRGRRLARMIVMARSLGKPVVFVRNVPSHLKPSMGWIAGSCDVVTDDGVGVQLGRFNPIGLPADRDSEPVYPGARDPRESPSVRALLDGAADLMTISGARSWRGLPDFYRRHGVLVATTADQASEQAACGARVIPIQDYLGDARRLREDLEAARLAGPPPTAEVREALREIYASSATSARLAAWASAAGLGSRIVADRQITVLAGADQWTAPDLATSVLRQRLQPADVVYSSDDPGALAALAPLTDRGIGVRVVPVGVEAASYASSPWVAPWTGLKAPVAATYLLDLAVARECSRADAVGTGPGAAFAYTESLSEFSLARRSLLLPEPLPGSRFFTITEE
jgi:hypothetical protein